MPPNGGHAIPEATIRRRYTRGWENLRNHYIELVDAWAIYDARQTPPRLIETGENPETPALMEDAAHYSKSDSQATNAAPVASPYFVGVEAALQRASAKAIAKARAAGLEPVVADNTSKKTDKDPKQKSKSS